GLRPSRRRRDGADRGLLRRPRAAAHPPSGHRLRLLRGAHHVRPHRRQVLDQQGRDHARGLHRPGSHRARGAGAVQRARRRPRWRSGWPRRWSGRSRWRSGRSWWRSGRSWWRSGWPRWRSGWPRWRPRRPARRPGRIPAGDALMLSPKRVKHRKHHRGRMRGDARGGVRVQFGDYGLKALERGWITNRQIEAARIAMTRKIKRGGKVWINIFPDKPVTAKPAETRMGSGKGSPEGWVAVVKPGRVMFELAGVPEPLAREAMRLAGHKLSVRTKFVMREDG